MKFCVCVLALLYLFSTGSSQPFYGRPHPLYNRQQQAAENFLTAALLFGVDFSELPALQQTGTRQPGGPNVDFALRNLALALGLGPSLGLPTHPFARQRARHDMNALSMLGIIDGPDVPDGPAGGAGPRGRRGRRPNKAPAAEGAEGAPAKGPKRRGPQRGKGKGKAAAAKK